MTNFLEGINKIHKDLTCQVIRVKSAVRHLSETPLRQQYESELPELGEAADKLNWDFLTGLSSGNTRLLIINQFAPTPQKRTELDAIIKVFGEKGLGEVKHEVVNGRTNQPILISHYCRPTSFGENLHQSSNMRVSDRKPLRIFLWGIGEFVLVDEAVTPNTTRQLENIFDCNEIEASNNGRFFFYGDEKYGLKYQRIGRVFFPWNDKNLIMYVHPEPDHFNIKAPQGASQKLKAFIPAQNVARANI